MDPFTQFTLITFFNQLDQRTKKCLIPLVGRLDPVPLAKFAEDSDNARTAFIQKLQGQRLISRESHADLLIDLICEVIPNEKDPQDRESLENILWFLKNYDWEKGTCPERMNE